MDLFADFEDLQPGKESLAAGAVVLRRYACRLEFALLEAIGAVTAEAPFRRMMTPGGFSMSVAMTNCGSLGWVTDRKGYRYQTIDPESGRKWPPMPKALATLAAEAASIAGFCNFLPDACLINRYEAGARMSLHQDKDERDFAQPIVSVSLGLPAVFLFGGLTRADKPLRVPVFHGDVIVWGGPARMRFHGIDPLKPGAHPVFDSFRVNLTFRKAG